MLALPAPVILESPRLLLTEIVVDDAEGMFELNSDPEVLRYTGDAPFPSLAASRAFLEAYPDYRENGFGRWAVRRRKDGQLLGWCGLKRDRATGEIDLGYRLHRRFWGHGYATESGRACIRWGFDARRFTRIVGRAAAANAASVRVLEKCGMRREGTCDFSGEPGLLYAIERAPVCTPAAGGSSARR